MLPKRYSPLFAVWAFALSASLVWAEEPAQKPTESAAASAASAAQDKHSEEYYEAFRLLADTLDEVERNYVQEVDRRELIEAAIGGVISKLDPYSSFIPPGELASFRSSVDSEFGGIGIQIAIDAGQLKVLSPIVGSPAYRLGLQAGDAILEIDGQSTKGLTLDQAVKKLKGKAETSVRLTVRKVGSQKPETHEIKRELIRVETVLGDRRRADDSWNFLFDPERKLGYIRISSFSRDTTRELRAALEQLGEKNLRGLVIDLRNNPGGLLSSAIEISDLFLKEGMIVSTEGRNTKRREWKAHEEGTFAEVPLVVMVNKYSASASEIVSACLQDHHRAVIVGERTWGKGSVQNIIELEGGKSALKLTTASYQRPSGKSIHRFPNSKDWGVSPDAGMEVTLTDEEVGVWLKNRRDRDIVPPRPKPQLLAEGTPPEPEEVTPDAPPVVTASIDRQLQKALDYFSRDMASAK